MVKKRTRRSKEEVIDCILEAAGAEFERKGYAGTKTADIARKAGVVEPLIFTHFGSKAKLFQDAVFKPLDRHFETFFAAHPVEPGDTDSLRQYTREYILEQKKFIERHSGTLMSLIVTQTYLSDDVSGLNQIAGLQHYFNRSAEVAKQSLKANPKIDTNILSRISFASVLSCVIFKDWLFPNALASEDEINDAIVNFVMEGLEANAGDRLKVKAATQSTKKVGTNKTTKKTKTR